LPGSADPDPRPTSDKKGSGSPSTRVGQAGVYLFVPIFLTPCFSAARQPGPCSDRVRQGGAAWESKRKAGRRRDFRCAKGKNGSTSKILASQLQNSVQRSEFPFSGGENRSNVAKIGLAKRNVGSTKRISVRGRKNRLAVTKIDIAVPEFCSPKQKSLSPKQKSLQRAEQRSTEEQISTGNGSAELPDGISAQSPSKDQKTCNGP